MFPHRLRALLGAIGLLLVVAIALPWTAFFEHDLRPVFEAQTLRPTTWDIAPLWVVVALAVVATRTWQAAVPALWPYWNLHYNTFSAELARSPGWALALGLPIPGLAAAAVLIIAVRRTRNRKRGSNNAQDESAGPRAAISRRSGSPWRIAECSGIAYAGRFARGDKHLWN